MNTIAERRLEEKERRRAEILDAAVAVAGESGIAALTMDEVARKARLSRALLYVYFQDRSDLMFALCERALAQLHRQFSVAIADVGHGRAQVEAMGRAYVAFSHESPVYFDALAQFETHPASADEFTSNEAACVACSDNVHELMVGCIDRGKADGSIRADVGSSALVALTLWGFMHGIIQLAKNKKNVIAHDGFDVAQLVNHALFLASRALTAAPAEAPP